MTEDAFRVDFHQIPQLNHNSHCHQTKPTPCRVTMDMLLYHSCRITTSISSETFSALSCLNVHPSNEHCQLSHIMWGWIFVPHANQRVDFVLLACYAVQRIILFLPTFSRDLTSSYYYSGNARSQQKARAVYKYASEENSLSILQDSNW